MNSFNTYRFLVEPVSEPNLVNVLEESLIKGKLVYSMLIEKKVFPKITEKSISLIVKCKAETESAQRAGYPGINPNKDTEYRIDQFGPNIKRSNSGDYYSADVEGVFYLYNTIPKLVEMDYSASFDVKISSDNMKVMLDFYPSHGSGKNILIKEVFNEIRTLKIDVEIKTDAIDEALNKLKETKKVIRNVVVAEGQHPVDGIDGWVDYIVSTDVDYSPTLTEDGRLDFYNLNVINPVNADQSLARFHPHKEEKNGYDVFGKKISGRVAKVVKFPAGKNTYVKPEDPNLILAKVEGNVIRNVNQIIVSEVFAINGNVDFSTGNIFNPGSVKILGDIKSNFRVECGDSLEVRGLIEDSYVKVGQNLQLNSGFVGTGAGVIYAGGDVNMKYVRNQKVFSRKSIFVQNEVIDAELYAKTYIHVTGGRNMSILGGIAVAGNSIEVSNLGNEYGIPTKIEVGYDYDIANKIQQNNLEIQRMTDALETIDTSLRQMLSTVAFTQEQKVSLEALISKKIKLYETPEEFPDFYEQLERINEGFKLLFKSTSLREENITTFLGLFEQKISFNNSVKIKRGENLLLNKQIYTPSNARVIVKKNVYPGVVISINKRRMNIQSLTINKTFYLSKEYDAVVMM